MGEGVVPFLTEFESDFCSRAGHVVFWEVLNNSRVSFSEPLVQVLEVLEVWGGTEVEGFPFCVVVKREGRVVTRYGGKKGGGGGESDGHEMMCPWSFRRERGRQGRGGQEGRP